MSDETFYNLVVLTLYFSIFLAVLCVGGFIADQIERYVSDRNRTTTRRP